MGNIKNSTEGVCNRYTYGITKKTEKASLSDGLP